MYRVHKKKSNAVSLAKWLMIVFVIFSIYDLILNVITTDVPYENVFEGTIFGGITGVIRNIIVSGAWLLYFSYSKRVQNTFPVHQRKLYKLDKSLIVVMILLPLFPFVYGMLLAISKEEGTFPSISTQHDLLKGEYTDGRVYFIAPESFVVTKNYTGFKPIYNIWKGEGDSLISMVIQSDISQADNKNYFEWYYNLEYEGISGGTQLDFEILVNTNGTVSTTSFPFFERAIKIQGENDYIFGIVTVFDVSTKKVAYMVYFGYYTNKDEIYKYKNQLIKTIKFN